MDRERGIFIVKAYQHWCEDARVPKDKNPMGYLKPYHIEDYLKTLPLDTPMEEVVEKMIAYCYERGGSIVPQQLQQPMLVNGQKAKHLYVIGNGFDRYHGTKCSYWDFRQYMLRRKPDVVAQFDVFFGPRTLENSFLHPLGWCLALEDRSTRRYFGLPYPQTTWSERHLWCSFEEYLSELNREKLLEYMDMNLPQCNTDEDEFYAAEYFATIHRIIDTVNDCTFEMRYLLHRWVNTLHFASGWKKKMLDLDGNALYLTFNYTNFLEENYGIPKAQVLHIHGSRSDKFGSLVIGHYQDDQNGFDRWKHKCEKQRRFRPNLKDRKGRWFANDHLTYLSYFLKDETKGNWRLDTRYYATNRADEEIEQYYDKNQKQTSAIIGKNQGFFMSLDEVEEVSVIGHSLAKVDMPYFEQIIKNLGGRSVRWSFSVHGKKDETNVRRFCRTMKIPKDYWTMFQL